MHRLVNACGGAWTCLLGCSLNRMLTAWFDRHFHVPCTCFPGTLFSSILDPLPVPTDFLLYRPNALVFNVLILRHRVIDIHKRSRLLRISKCNTRTRLRRSIIQTGEPGVPDKSQISIFCRRDGRRFHFTNIFYRLLLLTVAFSC